MPVSQLAALKPTSKSERTRAALISASRKIITRDGYFNARIVDIAKEAGKSVGVFYTYFDNKSVLFAALVDEFYQSLEVATPDPADYADDPAGLVRAGAEMFWMTYKAHHADVTGLFETAFMDPELREIWRKMRERGIRRFTYRIRKQQERGYCLGIDPLLGASALAGLLEFSCFNWQVGKLDFPKQDVTDEVAINTLSLLLQNAMQLNVTAPQTTK